MNRASRAVSFVSLTVIFTCALAGASYLWAQVTGDCVGQWIPYENTQCRGKTPCSNGEVCAGTTSFSKCPTNNKTMNFKTATANFESVGSCSEYNEKVSCSMCSGPYYCAEWVAFAQGTAGKNCSDNCPKLYYTFRADACK
jgi:hypothetical protein